MTLVGKQFWASLPGNDGLVDEVKLRTKRYFDAAAQLGLVEAWREADAMYFMRDRRQGSTGAMSIKLDLGTRTDTRVKIRIPEARSLLRQQLAFVMSEKTSFQCVANMGEQRSVMTAELADTAVNYVYDERIRPEMRTFAEYAFEFGACGTHLRWDATKGDDVTEKLPLTNADQSPMLDQNGQQMVHEQPGKSGAPFVDALTPFEYATDPKIGLKAGWAVAFERTNLYTLAGQHAAKDPALAESILGLSTRDEFSQFRLMGTDDGQLFGANDGDVWAIHFYYADRPELQGGRYALIVGDKAVLDIPKCPLGGGRLPVRVLLTSKMTDSAFSFADGWGLFAGETALNKLRSSELTNAAYFGNQARAMEEGTRTADLERTSGNETRTYIYKNGGKPPSAVEVTPMPDQTQLKQDFISTQSRISGFSDVSRGSSSVEKTTSGAHAAVFEAITARNLSLPQGDFVKHEEELANDVLEMLQNYANTAFIVEIAGKEGAPIAKEFAPQDLSSVRRVRAKGVPDSMRGPLARLGLLEQTKDIEDPRERAKAVNFVTHGDDEYGKNDQRSQNLISIENERLLTGEYAVSVCPTENHYNHMVDHQSALDQLRTQPVPDPQAVMRFAEHIMGHGEGLMNQDPILAQAMGYPPPPVMPGNPAFVFQQSLNAAQQILNPAPPPDAADGGAPGGKPANQQTAPQKSEAAA